MYIAYINEITPNNVKIPCRKLFAGLFFFSLSATAYNAEINTRNGISNISTHKSNVQNPIKNSTATEIAILSFINFLKKRASLASSIVFANNGNSTNMTQKIVSFTNFRLQISILYKPYITRHRKEIKTK